HLRPVLSLNTSTGAITGTTSAAVTFNFTITATDSLGATGNRAYSIVVNAPISVTPASLPNTTQGVAYSQAVTGSGGTGALTYSVSAGALPSGVSSNASSGALTGTPSAAGTFNFTITPTDTVGASGSQSYSVTINAPLTVNPASLAGGTVSTAYSQTVSATGGTGASTFAVTSGSLPTGLSLNVSSGEITGTPTSAATFNFTITATDTVGATGSRAYSVTVSAASLTVSPTTLPAPTRGVAYSQTITTSGGTAPYTYSVTGSLPTGLSLNTSTGAITGTSSASGTFNFTINASDSLGATGSRAYSVVVNVAISVAQAALANAAKSAAYSESVTD